jgi:hypothetical protein
MRDDGEKEILIYEGVYLMIQRRIQKNTGQADQPSRVPFMGRLIRKIPLVRNLPAYLTAYGLFPPDVQMEEN